MGTQTAFVIAILYGVVSALGLAVALLVALSTRRRPSDEGVETYRHNETRWLGIVVGLLAVLLLATIFLIPYDDEASGRGAQVVEVTAAQFAWQVRPRSVPAGVPIEFRLRSLDVNHGFGIYDRHDNLKKQAQVLPGETQTLVYTFDEPGTYRILCLEFCGFGHHGMIGQLRVTG
ncbi:MAG TPA: cupredoxin domain-containing protein [Gaiellaceae bacterium]|nr:cupredoxin domain-containing protein [Gaiellaceae bacterium]